MSTYFEEHLWTAAPEWWKQFLELKVGNILQLRNMMLNDISKDK